MPAAKRLRLLGALGVVGLSLLTACSASAKISAGDNQVDKAEVESQVATQLAKNVNQPKPDISCPSGLDAKVGASIDCTLTAQGDSTKLPVHVVVDSVSDGTAHFTAQVGGVPGSDAKVAFCKENAALDKAMSGASSPSDLLPILKANKDAIDTFGKDAPEAVQEQATVLVNATHTAIDKNDASGFADATVQSAGQKVDSYCGTGSTTTTAAP